MKILVTVGTTRFDSLIKYLDELVLPSDMAFTFQIADGAYKPVNHPFFSFSEKIDQYYQSSDVIICHAGAGTIYKLLELRKRIIIVPNTERTDNHQLDIAAFMGNNGYALTVIDFDELFNALQQIKGIDLLPFEKHDFDKTGEILRFSVSGN
ncbi:Glycosyltransferase family 28 C-terminal domain-containing protein [Cyclobacterium lianum]|uniref:Glycosyltransferase family 28 C-terminal domain-containing protein n=1 Tax=Cyclobacterium lianum TaxID=388280 RepID=A0A1M7NDE3_9BACT|nr:PssE/Cps14G family polysaccharide biosynthesis glycosyltransferase [Cyclobacterium lianum]SHN01667.1 Glycosyltransferase family 28 C-terminal domain-containing protein [Cyclobacterium lianum]